MTRKNPSRSDNLRRALAQEAARIMAEHGIRDFFVAKKKAAERLGVSDGSAVLPKNTEIETALVEYQRLFGGDSHTESLYAQRRAALSAMRYLQRVRAATGGSGAQRHRHRAFRRAAPSVHRHRGVGRHEAPGLAGAVRGDGATRENERGARARLPGCALRDDDFEIEATVFPTDGIRQAPVSPVDGRPMKRANAFEVEALLDEQSLAARGYRRRRRPSGAATGQPRLSISA